MITQTTELFEVEGGGGSEGQGLEERVRKGDEQQRRGPESHKDKSGKDIKLKVNVNFRS